MNTAWKRTITWIFLLLPGILYLLRLWYPHLSLLVTPDFGRSDAWHFSFPTKYALSQALASHTLPLWRNDIGDGFPLFAEGQTGALFLPNLILFSLFPAVIAYNAALVFSFVTFSAGMYLWSRSLGNTRIAAIFAGTTLMGSALTITQLPHITLLQGMGMIPLLLVAARALKTDGSARSAGIFALLLSQQFFAGFPQATLLGVLLTGGYLIWDIPNTRSVKPLLLWTGAVILGIVAGGAQLLPSWEFLRQVTDPGGFDPTKATYFSMPPKHLLSFLIPFALGNPRVGSYPAFYRFDGSIFWENTAYIGLVPLILAVTAFIRHPSSRVRFWALVAAASILLAGGKYSPAYLLFSVWPLTLFRVPSRFLWLALIAILTLGSDTVSSLERTASTRGKIFLVIVLFVHAGALWVPFWNYHLYGTASDWLSRPETALSDERTYTIGQGKAYNDIFTTRGWPDEREYRDLREGLGADSNILWGIRQHSAYAGRFLKRPAITEGFLNDTISSSGGIATVSGQRFLNASSVRSVISYEPLNAPNLILRSIHKTPSTTFYSYDNPTALPRAYVVREATSASTLREAAVILTDPAFIWGSTVFLEPHETTGRADIARFLTPNAVTDTRDAHVSWVTDEHQRIVLNVTAERAGILVLTDTAYPGWVATVDGNRTPILTANLSQRAVVLPGGTHVVEFRFVPDSLRRGAYLTLIGYVIITFLMAVRSGVSFRRIAASTPPPSRHYRGRTRK